MLLELSRVDPRRTRAGRRLEARLRASLHPIAARIAIGGPGERRMGRARSRLEGKRAELATQQASWFAWNVSSRSPGATRAVSAVTSSRRQAAFTPFVVAEVDGTRYVVRRRR